MTKIGEQVEEYLEYCEKVRGMTAATLLTKRNVLTRFVRESGVGKLAELDNVKFNHWVECEVARGVSARSLNTYNAVVVAWVRYYREMGAFIPLKIALIKKLKTGKVQRKFYTAKEVARVVSMAPDQTGLMIRAMFETGMRIAELARLKCSDMQGRRVEFIGKGQKPREVYISEGLRRDLDLFLRRHERPLWAGVWGDFSGKTIMNGMPPTTATVRKWLRAAFLAAGFKDFYPHALRHSFATDLQLKGASVAEIKEMMGHASIATTERYLHGFEGRMKELFDKYR